MNEASGFALWCTFQPLHLQDALTRSWQGAGGRAGQFKSTIWPLMWLKQLSESIHGDAERPISPQRHKGAVPIPKPVHTWLLWIFFNCLLLSLPQLWFYHHTSTTSTICLFPCAHPSRLAETLPGSSVTKGLQTCHIITQHRKFQKHLKHWQKQGVCQAGQEKMECVCAASFSRKTKLLPLKGALQEKEPPQRESRHFLWETKPGNITSNTWLPPFSPSGTSSSREAPSHLFSSELSVLVLSIPCSSGHGKNEPLGAEITGFLLSCSSAAWPALEVQPECGQNVLILAHALWSPRKQT